MDNFLPVEQNTSGVAAKSYYTAMLYILSVIQTDRQMIIDQLLGRSFCPSVLRDQHICCLS